MIGFYFQFTENQVSFVCHMKKGGLEYRDEEAYESVQFIGYFREYSVIEKSVMHKSFSIIIWHCISCAQGTMSRSMNYYHRQAAAELQLTMI